MTVAVVGAGLAGLSAAWELRRAGAEAIVLDAGRRPGGMIVTERQDGFIVEGGPDGFLAGEPDIQELARHLGIEGRLVDQVTRGSTLWTGQRLEPLAEGKAAELLGIQVNANVGSGFRTFATGMADVVQALVACLVPRLRTTQGVTAVARAPRGWRLSFTGASSLDAEAVILAVPAWVAARLLAGLGISVARALDAVLYAPSITVSLAYPADQVPGTLEGAGFVTASASGAAVRACTYAWRKYPNRAPEVCRTGGRRSGRDSARRALGHLGYRGRSRLDPRLPLAAGVAALPARARRAGGCGPGAARRARAARDRGGRVRWCRGLSVCEVGERGGAGDFETFGGRVGARLKPRLGIYR